MHYCSDKSVAKPNSAEQVLQTIIHQKLKLRLKIEIEIKKVKF